MFAEMPFFVMSELTTKRLLLRQMTMRDAQDMFEYSRDPEVARHVLWDAHTSIGESRSYIRSIIRKYKMGEPASWGIEHTSSGKLIGTIGYMWHQSEHHSAEVGYSLSRAYWNQGLMTEALRAVIEHTFSDTRINRLEAQHETGNPASGAVMRKAGMRFEGTLRGRLYNKGRYVDVNLYAILRSDYAQRTDRRDGQA